MGSRLPQFNLLATCGKYREFEATHELERLLSLIGDEGGSSWESEVMGLLYAQTSLKPREALEKLRELLMETPWEFNLIRRVIPAEIVVKTNLEAIREACVALSERIPRNETFRVTVEKRRTQLHSRDIIEAAAERVESKVDLENPDKVILIEVIGLETGISLLEGRGGILNVSKELLGEI